MAMMHCKLLIYLRYIYLLHIEYSCHKEDMTMYPGQFQHDNWRKKRQGLPWGIFIYDDVIEKPA